MTGVLALFGVGRHTACPPPTAMRRHFKQHYEINGGVKEKGRGKRRTSLYLLDHSSYLFLRCD